MLGSIDYLIDQSMPPRSGLQAEREISTGYVITERGLRASDALDITYAN